MDYNEKRLNHESPSSFTFPKYNGHYVGIVVQNNDPQYRGRVKVFVPHISPTSYKSWNQVDKDKNFNFLGKISTNDQSILSTTLNTVTGTSTEPAGTGDLTVILEDLKKILPWAEVAIPLTGGGSSGRYNATAGYGSVSDSNNLEYTKATDVTDYSQNPDNIGEKPANVYDVGYNRISDAFSDPKSTNANKVNKYSYEYVPEAYSNSAKGSFPVLNVGAHVWIFFNDGDPLKPVVFGLSYGSNDWATIFGTDSNAPGQDYPGTYENIVSDDPTDYNVNTYRNKYVINQKGGTISFVNTDNREALKFTHYAGSFKEFNNQTTIEFAANNDQKLVIGDQFSTVRGSRNEFTQSDSDNIVVGDSYRKVGDLKFDLYKQWKSEMENAKIPFIKQLFDIRRTNGVTGVKAVDGNVIRLNGANQKKSGTPYLCPLCSANEQHILAVNNTFSPQNYALFSRAPGYSSSFGDAQFGYSYTNNGIEPSLVLYTEKNKLITGSFPLYKIISNNSVVYDQQGDPLVSRPGIIGDVPCPVCNPQSPFNKELVNAPGITLKAGYSPSSFRGSWDVETQKKQLKTIYKNVLPKLAKIEAQMGPGGSEIIDITKHKIETIGTVMNDWGAVRVDPYGKMDPAFVAVTPYMPVTVERPSPLIEQVQVDDLPGGTYTLNVCNKFNVLVGAGGISMKSYGVINISGAMANIAAEQVNIGSANEVNIDGGKRLNLVGDIVSIRQRNNEQVLLDSNVGITGNLIVKGGIFVEGNLASMSSSSPTVKRTTDQTKVTGRARADATVGITIPMDTVGKLEDAQLRPDTQKYVYMGYTDPGKNHTWVPADRNNSIAVIKAGQTIYLQSITGFQDPQGGQISVIPDNATITLSRDCPVYSTGFTGRGTGYNQRGGSDPKIMTVSTTEPQNVLSLRGLPNEKVKDIIDAATRTSGDKDATLLSPTMTIGAGAHPDSIVNNPHSHSYNDGENPAHAFVRAEFAAAMQNGNVPTKVKYHGTSAEQNVESISNKFTSFLTALRGS
jgi:hypothetical protein